MERYREALRWPEGFEAVWRRVRAARDPKTAAEVHGVTLMPRRQRCAHRCRKN